MNNTKILEYIENGKIEELKILLQGEIRQEENKAPSCFKAIQSLSKKVKKEMISTRPTLAGAYYYEKRNSTYICNGYYCLSIKGDSTSGLYTIDNEVPQESRLDLENILAPNRKLENEIVIDYNALKNAKKLKEQEYKVNDMLFNTEYLINIIECFKEPIVRTNNDANYPMLYIVDKSGEKEGLLLGLRKVK